MKNQVIKLRRSFAIQVINSYILLFNTLVFKSQMQKINLNFNYNINQDTVNGKLTIKY